MLVTKVALPMYSAHRRASFSPVRGLLHTMDREL